MLVIDNMLWHDQVADPAARDATTSTLRDLGKSLRDHDELVTGAAARSATACWSPSSAEPAPAVS